MRTVNSVIFFYYYFSPIFISCILLYQLYHSSTSSFRGPFKGPGLFFCSNLQASLMATAALVSSDLQRYATSWLCFLELSCSWCGTRGWQPRGAVGCHVSSLLRSLVGLDSSTVPVGGCWGHGACTWLTQHSVRYLAF